MNYIDEFPCYYCGDAAQCVDHLVPFKMRQCGRRRGSKLAFGPRVRTCNDCNQILGDIGILTAEGRKQFVATKLKIRLKKYLRIPHWTESELAELGHFLRSDVESAIQKRDALLRRYEVATLLQWCNPEELIMGESAGLTVDVLP